MTSEDTVAAKLKGNNCVIKFKDGEELPIYVPSIISEDDSAEWFADVEQYLNGEDGYFFPLSGFAIVRDTVKYVKRL